MELLTIKDYARRSTLRIDAIRRMCKANTLPAIKIGVAWRIDALAADEVLRQKIAARKKPTIIYSRKSPATKTDFLARLAAL